MPEAKTPHLDDFTLLRYVAFDLNEIEQTEVANHVDTCVRCQTTLREIEELDGELRALAKDPSATAQWAADELPQGDPFRRRPTIAARTRYRSGDSSELAARSVAASEEGAALSIQTLEAAKTSSHHLLEILTEINSREASHRFGLLYALQEAGRQIAENPARFLISAELVISSLRSRKPGGTLRQDAEWMVPTELLLGQAHQLAGQACLWTGEFDRSEAHLRLAYRFFAVAGEELGLAGTELNESQRRVFVGRGAEALLLAHRACVTFEALGLEDYVARARVVEGLALSNLDRRNEAVQAYRAAVPVFEKLGLWSNYVGAVNSVGTALAKMGQISEARQEYAHALRHLSHEHHRGWVALLRHSLAEVLFLSGRYREAAISLARARRLYADSGLVASALKSALFEIESWARAGEILRATKRLEIFEAEVSRLGALDGSISRKLNEALSGKDPDLGLLADLRRQAAEALRESLEEKHA